MAKALLLFLLLFSTLLRADILKENFVTFDFNGTSPKALLDFESDNLEKFIPLDSNHNGIISWRELKAKKTVIEAFVLKHISIMIDQQACHITILDFQVYRRVHQSYIKLPILLDCPLPKQDVTLKYNLFFDVDKDQKLFVKTSQSEAKPRIMSAREQEIDLPMKKGSLWDAFVEFLVEGIWHIWMGFDHILFLLMLLIPSVYTYHDKQLGVLIKPTHSLRLRRKTAVESFISGFNQNTQLIPRKTFAAVFKEILKITTAFTLAHSITLALSVTEVLTLPPNFVEVAIALSVLFTAINNIYLFTRTKTWIIAFAFGLIHGFGFANVLHELLNKKEDFVGMLLGFNLGVEIGQMVIVIALLPLLYFVRKTHFYRKAIMIGFSTLTAIIASIWAIERAFNLSILPW